MIVYKQWTKKRRDDVYGMIASTRDGWFLFGIIPLYIRIGKDFKEGY